MSAQAVSEGICPVPDEGLLAPPLLAQQLVLVPRVGAAPRKFLPLSLGSPVPASLGQPGRGAPPFYSQIIMTQVPTGITAKNPPNHLKIHPRPFLRVLQGQSLECSAVCPWGPPCFPCLPLWAVLWAHCPLMGAVVGHGSSLGPCFPGCHI